MKNTILGTKQITQGFMAIAVAKKQVYLEINWPSEVFKLIFIFIIFIIMEPC